MTELTKKCIFCQSDIPINAKKCRFCMEWQDDDDELPNAESQKEQIQFVDKFDNIQIPFQVKLIKKIPLNFIVSILLICAVIFVAVQISWYILGEEKVYLLSFLSFTIQLLISWVGLIWVYNILNKEFNSFIQISSLSKEKAEQKFYKYHKLMFNQRYSVLAGIFIGLIASVGDYYVGTPFKTEEAKLIFAGFEFINMFFAGATIYSIAVFALFLRNISYQPIHKKLDLDKLNSIKNIGALHLKTSGLAIVPLFLGVVAKLFGNWNWDILIIIWYVSFAVIIVVYIYYPIFHIHNTLKKDIDIHIEIIQRKIKHVLIDIDNNPSSRNFFKINELRELEESISNQNTWPFDIKSLSAAFFAIIFPIALIIVEKIVG